MRALARCACLAAENAWRPSLKSVSLRQALKPGAKADITLIDLDEPWLVARDALTSRSKNTPFEDARFSGRAVATYVGGKPVFTL